MDGQAQQAVRPHSGRREAERVNVEAFLLVLVLLAHRFFIIHQIGVFVNLTNTPLWCIIAPAGPRQRRSRGRDRGSSPRGPAFKAPGGRAYPGWRGEAHGAETAARTGAEDGAAGPVRQTPGNGGSSQEGWHPGRGEVLLAHPAAPPTPGGQRVRSTPGRRGKRAEGKSTAGQPGRVDREALEGVGRWGAPSRRERHSRREVPKPDTQHRRRVGCRWPEGHTVACSEGHRPP